MSCKSRVFVLLLALSSAASAQPAATAAHGGAQCETPHSHSVPVAPAYAWQRVGAPAHPHA